MTDKDLLECSESVLNFLLKNEEEFKKLKHFNTPCNYNMYNLLKSYNTNMCDFSEILNKKLRLLNEPLWINTPQEFFFNRDVSEKFFKNAIDVLSRRNKIIELKQRIYG